jgi:flavin-dependent dehydrogenase
MKKTHAAKTARRLRPQKPAGTVIAEPAYSPMMIIPHTHIEDHRSIVHEWQVSSAEGGFQIACVDKTHSSMHHVRLSQPKPHKRWKAHMSYDIMVYGAGVSGSVAGMLLAGHGLDVVMIDTGQVREPVYDWLSCAGADLLRQVGVDLNSLDQQIIRTAVFHDHDLSQSATATGQDPCAMIINRSQLVSHLWADASRNGAKLVDAGNAITLETQENGIIAHGAEAEPIQARFLVCADGAAGSWMRREQVPDRWIATATTPTENESDAAMHWMLGMNRRRQLAQWWQALGQHVFRLHACGQEQEVVESARQLMKSAQAQGVLDIDENFDTVPIHCAPQPARWAIEFESHVGKRSLEIGEAGGFVAAASRESIYPAAWSAKLAADILVEAASKSHPQDDLRRFSKSWRSTMAEYLQPPNTDLHFLLPLVFSNQQMANRMAYSFWHGQSI